MKAVILTFPNRLPEEHAELIQQWMKDALPGVRVVIVDQCTSATLIDLPDEPSAAPTDKDWLQAGQ